MNPPGARGRLRRGRERVVIRTWRPHRAARPTGAARDGDRDGLERMTISASGTRSVQRIGPKRSSCARSAPDRESTGHCGSLLNPPEHAVVLCVDEKAQIQALDRTQPLLPMRPGQIERRTHDYTRHGTTSLSRRSMSKRARSSDSSIDVIAPSSPKVPRRDRCRRAIGLAVHLILDNYGTHKTPLIQRWMAKRHGSRALTPPTGRGEPGRAVVADLTTKQSGAVCIAAWHSSRPRSAPTLTP